jgi:hypothetical protein
LRAKNGVGIGAFSEIYNVITDSVPTFAPVPEAALVTPKTVSLTWAPVLSFIETGGDGVISYVVEFDNSIMTGNSGVADWKIVNKPAEQGIVLSFTFVNQ